MGDDSVWDRSEGALAESLTELGPPFEYSPGEGAFYGPKLEFHFVDALGRSWQTGTIQVDFNLPEAFDLKYTGGRSLEGDQGLGVLLAQDATVRIIEVPGSNPDVDTPGDLVSLEEHG